MHPEPAILTGETKTHAVIQALKERLHRLQQQRQALGEQVGQLARSLRSDWLALC
jgi:hypothetical protein